MEMRENEDVGSPSSQPTRGTAQQIPAVSDSGSDRLQSPPALLALAPSRDSHRFATTDESVTTFEDESSARVSSGRETALYSVSGKNVAIRGQVTRRDVFQFIVDHAPVCGPAMEKVPASMMEQYKCGAASGLQKRKRKQQVSVKYKAQKQGGASMFVPAEERVCLEEQVDRLSLTFKSDQQSLDETEQEEERRSLTCQNPIAIIQDLKVDSKPQPEQIIGDETFRTENELLKQSAKAQQLLFEAKQKELESENAELIGKLSRADTRTQLLEEENMQLARQADLVLNVSKAEIGCETVFAPVESRSVSIQTDSASWQQLIDKMREELAAQAQTLGEYEKEKMTILARQQRLVDQAETEKTAGAKQRKSLQSELQSAKQELERQRRLGATVASDLHESKLRLSRLELENRALTCENAKLKDRQPISSNAVMERLGEADRHIDELKQENHRRAGKIREVKKERDLLRIEVLKLKQIFSEKCDNYREIRNRLCNKLKQKDSIIAHLQQQQQNSGVYGKPPPNERPAKLPFVGGDDHGRSRSLENTGAHAVRELRFDEDESSYYSDIANVLTDQKSVSSIWVVNEIGRSRIRMRATWQAAQAGRAQWRTRRPEGTISRRRLRRSEDLHRVRPRLRPSVSGSTIATTRSGPVSATTIRFSARIMRRCN